MKVSARSSSLNPTRNARSPTRTRRESTRLRRGSFCRVFSCPGLLLSELMSRRGAIVAPHEVSPLVEIRRDGDIEKTNHHLFVGLLAPADFLIRSGVMRVAARVVVPGDSLEHGACLQTERVRKFVAQLPFEIPAHLEQRLDAAAGMNQIVFEFFTTPVHMRKELHKRRALA